MLRILPSSRVRSLVAFVGTLVTACAPAGTPMPDTPALSPGSSAVVRGTVTYRDRSALPPDAEVEVWITDVTPGLMLTQAILARATVPATGRQVPIPFEVGYDPARVEASHRYAIKAVITAGGEMRYASTQEYPVITGGSPSIVDITVARTSANIGGGAPGANASPLQGTAWRLEDLGGAGVVDRVEATLEFSADGRVAGRGSCNRFFGTVTVSGQSITFGGIGATRMACPPAVSDQETKYFAALEQAKSYEVQDATLLITYAGSSKPLRFVRTTP